MADQTTPCTHHTSWLKPDVGANQDTWGALLNALADEIDDAVDALDHAATGRVALTEAVADAALPKAGGALTGRVDVATATMKLKNLGDVAGGTVTLNLTEADYFKVHPTAQITFAFSNVPNVADSVVAICVEVDRAVALPLWPASVLWPSRLAPSTYSTLGIDRFVLTSTDGGTTWLAAKVAVDVRAP